MAGGFALSGGIDYSTADPRLQIGVAGTRMTVSAFKRLWPAMVTPRLRSWVVEHISGGTVERVVVATNAPLSTLEPGGPPLPDDGLSIDIVTHRQYGTRRSTACRCCAMPISSTRVQGRTATVKVGRATVDLPSGRKITLTNGVFEVPDTHPKPSPARTRFRVEGTADAAAELLSLDRLRDASNVALDPATTEGNVRRAGRARLPLTGESDQGQSQLRGRRRHRQFLGREMGARSEGGGRSAQVDGELARLLHQGRREDRRAAGDASITASRRGDTDAEVRIQATLDDAGRARLGFGLGDTLSGPVPFKIARAGSRSTDEREPLPGRGRPEGQQDHRTAAGLVEGRRPARRASPSR